MTDAAASAIPFSCDLILKGGITSGIVYPPAIAEIARDHRFRSIGGSSAGAIAAASAAAAELGRASDFDAFALLETLPTTLSETDQSGRTLLERLFQPQRDTAMILDFLWSIRKQKGAARLGGIISRVTAGAQAPRSWVLIGLLAVVLAVAAGVIAAIQAGPWSLVASIPLVLVVVGVSIVAVKAGQVWAGARRLVAETPQHLARNLHGLCTGRTVDGSGTPGLTDWLYSTLQALAGRDGPSDPVTYGDLAQAGVELVTITTDISHGTSSAFPLPTSGWAFKKDEMNQLFPADVVDHLVRKASQTDSDEQRQALAAAGLTLLPPAEDVPIILGARISLSFPILLSAMPLYAWTPVRTGNTWTMAYEKCWFSDGGITSNLPVRLFDLPLPTRPTYAINLSSGPDIADTACENLWRPIEARQGQLPPVSPIGSTLQFLSAVFDTMQNWSDNAFSRAPGERDRICTVRLGPGEGGLNLDMPPQTIMGLSDRGRAAGANLAWMQRGTYDGCPVPSGIPAEKLARQWDRHRFTRYRTFLGGLGRYLNEAKSGAAFDFRPRPTYSMLSEDALDETWLPYRKGWTKARRARVETALEDIFGVDIQAMTATAPAGAALGLNPNDLTDPEQVDTTDPLRPSAQPS